MDWKLGLFIVGSLLIAFVSRASLASPRSHGFSRFFVWEAILGLAALNADRWFLDPFSWHQILSWLLLVTALVPLALGVSRLRAAGNQGREDRADPSLFGFEKTTSLVSDGIYRHIRHPLYSSLLILAWGVFFKAPSILGGALALAASSLLVVTARRDEKECIGFFGDEYRAYMKRTKRFIPFLF